MTNPAVPPYSSMTTTTRPYYSTYYNGFGTGSAYASPAMMRYYSNPNGFGAYYQSPGMTAYNYSAFGMSYYLATPGVAGYSFSPYTGYRSFAIPGQTINVPYGGALGGYNSYVPGGYVLP